MYGLTNVLLWCSIFVALAAGVVLVWLLYEVMHEVVGWPCWTDSLIKCGTWYVWQLVEFVVSVYILSCFVGFCTLAMFIGVYVWCLACFHCMYVCVYLYVHVYVCMFSVDVGVCMYICMKWILGFYTWKYPILKPIILMQ